MNLFIHLLHGVLAVVFVSVSSSSSEQQHRRQDNYPNSTFSTDLLHIINSSSYGNNSSTIFKQQQPTTSSFYNGTTSSAEMFNFSLRFRSKLEALMAQQQQQRRQEPPTESVQKNLSSVISHLRKQFAMPMPMRAVFQAMYALIFVVALAGNCAVIIVYRVARRWRRDISVFHLNLAVADILLAAFCVPFTAQQVLDHFWPWPPLMCPLVLFLQITSVSVSVYTLVVIGIDRLSFVRNPLGTRIFTGVRGRLIMLGVWTFSMLMAGGQLLFYRVTVYPSANSASSNDTTDKLCECKMTFDGFEYLHLFGNFLITYLIPLAVLVIIYVRVGRLVWAREPPGQRISHVGREQQVLAQKKQIITSLIIIVALFALAWLPLHLYVILYGLLPNDVFFHTASSTDRQRHDDIAATLPHDSVHDERAYYVNQVRRVYLPCHVIAMLSTCTNPLVYAFMHVTFRSDCRRALIRLRRWLLLRCCPARAAMLAESAAGLTSDSISVNTEYGFNFVTSNLSPNSRRQSLAVMRNSSVRSVGSCSNHNNYRQSFSHPAPMPPINATKQQKVLKRQMSESQALAGAMTNGGRLNLVRFQQHCPAAVQEEEIEHFAVKLPVFSNNGMTMPT